MSHNTGLTRREWLQVGCLLVALAVSLSLLAASLVRADIGHDSTDPEHWYPMECCHSMDCAPVTSASSEAFVTADGLMPRGMVVTTKHGTAFVPATFPRRESKDGRMHACMQPDSDGHMYVLCLFIPPGS